MKFASRHIASIIIYTIVLTLSVAKFGELKIVPFSGWDKFVHMCMYAALAGIMSLEQHFHISPGRLTKVDFLVLIALAVLYGVAIEFIQCLLPYRSGEWSDALANTLGAIVGVVVAGGISRCHWYVSLVERIKRFKKI